MIKAGLILGAVMLVLGIGGSLLSPICVPCLAVMAGVGAGYLAGVWEKPLTSGGSAKVGAIAGAIGGAGALLGQIIGGILNAILVDPQQMMRMMEQFGLPTTYDSNFLYIAQIGGGVCFGLLDIVLMAGLGALGGILWQQIGGKNATPPSY
ncbi:MAG: hypothetical protein JXR84_07545 [Anaerolineae bacterium]|nr:hypothetical protein [Anaerolineae bacterium]